MLDTNNGNTRLLVFAKAPEPGLAKTRLMPLLGAEGAARLQARLTRRALVTALAANVGQVELWCAPDAGHAFFAALSAELGVALHGQCGGDLGEKILHAARMTLAQERYALIMGTDCPRLTPGHLRQVQHDLQGGRDAVLIPAEDGGYVLLGLARVSPALFAGVDWGSGRVLQQTRERLADLDFKTSALDPLPDVDRPEDCLALGREYPLIWHNLTSEESL
ncbi:MAG: glycosyltransferase [Methylococcaceae bacterium]|nr:MAG: glycosyltransferase [Methylococcaceae bacterium]